MEIAKLVLEFLKAFLTAPVLLSVITVIFILKFSEDLKALMIRLAKIKLPGGTEFSTHQRSIDPEGESKPPPNATGVPVDGVPPGLASEQQLAIEQLIRSHIGNAYLWEYRYLNLYLVHGTQVVLDWFIGLPQPTTYAHYDSFWLSILPSVEERKSIFNALQNHHLIEFDESTNMIAITEKGREYQNWRGALQTPTNASK